MALTTTTRRGTLGVTNRLAPLALYVLVVLILTWPLAQSLNTTAFGWAGKDQPEYIWSLWYSTRDILHGRNPARLDLLAHPDGYLHSVRQATLTTYIVALPLSWLPPVALYNVVVILGAALSGYVSYLLVYDYTGHRGASLLGGLVFLLFPSRWAHTLAGHLETAQTFWYPLAFLMLRRLVRSPGPRAALATAAVWAAAAMNSLPGTAYILLPLGLYQTVSGLVAGYRERCLSALVRMLALTGLVGALFLLPFVLPLAMDVLDGGSWLLEGGDIEFSADLLSVVAPTPGASVWRLLGGAPPAVVRATAVTPQEVIAYVGAIPVLLGIAALVVRRPRSEIAGLAGLALAAAILALGPVLKVGGGPLVLDLGPEVRPTALPLPYGLLACLPGFAIGRTPGRFIMVTGLALAVLSGHGVAALARRWRVRGTASGPMVMCLILLLAGEYVFAWPSPLYTIAPSPAATALGLRDPGAVLDVPMTERQVDQEGLVLQIQHGLPLYGGYIHRSIPVLAGSQELLDWATRPTADHALTPEPSAEEARAVLRAAGVRYVVLHLSHAADATASVDALRRRLDGPVLTDQGVAVFEVSPGELPEGLLVAANQAWWGMTVPAELQPELWLGHDALRLGVYSPTRTGADLSIESLALDHVRRLTISVNDQLVGHLIVGPQRPYLVPGLALNAGFNVIEISVEGDCVPVIGDARCVTHRLFGPDLECDPWDSITRCVGVLLRSIELTPAPTPKPAPTLGPLELAGARVSPVASVPGYLDVIISWRVASAVTIQPHVFLHVLSPTGALVAQWDLVPMFPYFRYSHWQSDDVISEHFAVPLPAALTRGVYRVVTGAYSYPDLDRWHVEGPGASADGQHVDIGLVAIDVN